ncbi:MAG: PQQ-binding-like beta-propeller repeat protein [Ktedonobacteraceae bacterium]
MKFILLRRFALLPLLSLTMFTLLCISSSFLQGNVSALAASHSSASVHSQALSTEQTSEKRPNIPNGGTLNCRYMDPTLQLFYSSPTVVNGIIYVGSVDHFVYALNANCTPLCRYRTGGPVYSSPTVFNGRLYIGSDDHFVYALNASNCRFIWRHRTGNFVRSSPITNGKIVYVGSNDKKVYALNAITGTLIPGWPFLTGGPVTSSPRFSTNGQMIYIGSKDHNVYALNAFTGALMPGWPFTTANAVDHSSAAVFNGVIYIGSTDTNLYALNATTGAIICNFTASGPVESSPTVATVNGIPTVFVGSDGTGSPPSNNGSFYSLTTACVQNWSYVPPPGITRNWVIDTPAVATINNVDTVYFGSLDHSVFALNAGTGGLIWSYLTGNYVDSSPTVVNGLLYIGSNDGYLYELTA